MEPTNDCFIATFDGYYGEGSTLEEALSELKNSDSPTFDIEEVEFYSSQRIKVSIKLAVENNAI